MGVISKGIERRARAEGLIDRSDSLLAVEAGDLKFWVSSGESEVISCGNCAVGYTAKRLVVIGAERVAAADLLMLFRVEVVPAIGWLTVTYLHDTDPYRTTFEWAMSRRREVARFAGGLEAAASRRRAEFPERVQDAVVDWGAELDRRISEHMRVKESLAGRVDVTASIPIELQRLAFDQAQAPTAMPERGARSGWLLLLEDGTFAVTSNVGVVARFGAPEITCFALRDNGPSLEPSALWEVGYRTTAGERHLFFEAAGLALMDGQVDVAADAFLRESELLPLMGEGDSWLTLEPDGNTDQDTPNRSLAASHGPVATQAKVRPSGHAATNAHSRATQARRSARKRRGR